MNNNENSEENEEPRHFNCMEKFLFAGAVLTAIMFFMLIW